MYDLLQVMLTDVNETQLRQTATELGSRHGKPKVAFAKCDITRKAEIESRAPYISLPTPLQYSPCNKLDVPLNCPGWFDFSRPLENMYSIM